MKYKIIACDMDETLLSSDATICRRNIEAITAAIAKGVKFVPCTGRGFRSIEGVLRTLGLYDGPLRPGGPVRYRLQRRQYYGKQGQPLPLLGSDPL